MMNKKNKITFLEEGRMNEKEMSELYGGKTYQNCSDAGPACPIVSGNGFTITANCAHNLYTCDTVMTYCSSEDLLSSCSGVSRDVKQFVGISLGTSIGASSEIKQVLAK